MKAQKLRVSLSFASGSDGNLEVTATTVFTNVYLNPAFQTVPVTAAVLEAAITAYTNARAAQSQGGTMATAVKNNRRTELVALLQQVAFYVQVQSDNDMAALLSSGFEAVSTNRTRSQLAKPSLKRIKNGLSGQALVTITADSNSRCFEIIVAEVDDTGAPGPYREPVIHTGSVNIPVANLVPGKLYAYQGRAIGGLTGFSDWSDVLVQRAA